MMETTGSMPQHNCKHYDGALLTTCVHSTVQTYQQEHLHLQLTTLVPKPTGCFLNWIMSLCSHPTGNFHCLNPTEPISYQTTSTSIKCIKSTSTAWS
jgi:hypothetical protein